MHMNDGYIARITNEVALLTQLCATEIYFNDWYGPLQSYDLVLMCIYYHCSS